MKKRIVITEGIFEGYLATLIRKEGTKYILEVEISSPIRGKCECDNYFCEHYCNSLFLTRNKVRIKIDRKYTDQVIDANELREVAD